MGKLPLMTLLVKADAAPERWPAWVRKGPQKGSAGGIPTLDEVGSLKGALLPSS